MSYFTADLENNQRESEKTPMSEEKKIIKARYEAMRKLIRKGMQKPMTEERVKEICNEVIDDFCKKNLIEVRENKRPININL